MSRLALVAKVWLGLIGVVGLVVLVDLGCAACGGGSSPANAGVPLPPTAGTALAPPALSSVGAVVVDESAVDRTIQSGRPTVIFFMATGCSSCAAQASALAAAAGKNGPVQLVGVDIAGGDDAETLRSFLDGAQLSALPISWTVDRDGHLAQRYEVQSLDESVGLVGGAVRFHDMAAVDPSQLRLQIQTLA